MSIAFTAGHRRQAAACFSLLALSLTPALASPSPVWTEHNDNGRTGQYLTETALTPANVNQTQFGKLFEYNLDDQSYTQPLYVPGLKMAVDGQVHDVVFVATVNNSVYAFDADSGIANNCTPLWKVSLTPAGGRAPNVADAELQGAGGGTYTDFVGQYGIVGTPVIDTSTDTLYVVARTVENGAFVQRLHALSLTSGAEVMGGPVVISGSAGGVNFDPALNNQRPALALVDGVVYIGWASHGDNGAYHGFLMGYSASTLQQTSIWAVTNASGLKGGIWNSGQAITADVDGDIYVVTGNGTWDGTANFGSSFVKLTPGLSVLDYFTPSNYKALNGADTDLGSSGCLGIPGTTLLFGGGKQGMVYLVDSGKMGHEGATDAVVQEFQATFPPSGDTGHIHGGPAYFDSVNGQYIYLWGENDFLRTFQFTNGAASNQGSINSTPVASSTMRAPVTNAGMPGGFLSISADGNQNGIVWAYTPFDGNANTGTVKGILHAFNAQTFSGSTLTELWNSQQNSTRDSVGNYAKFTYPTIANGRVYVSTFGSTSSGTGQLVVYGEGPSQVTPKPVIRPNGGAFPATVTITDTNASATLYYTVDGSLPTPGNVDTIKYTAPFSVDACETVTAMALVPQSGWIQSGTVIATFTASGTAGSGTGLLGTYYNGMNLTGSAAERIDPTVDFTWSSSNTSPMTGIGPDGWSASWTGYVQPEFTDSYTFTTVTNDGVKLWVNGQLIVNEWRDQPALAESGSITLTAGQKYPIVMEYYQDGTGATAQLYWQCGCQPEQIIPTTQLYPAQVAEPTFGPAAENITAATSIAIADATPGASIYYTTSGKIPTPGAAGTTLYSAPVSISPNTTLEAVATLTGCPTSAVAVATYTIPGVERPSMTPQGGTHPPTSTITMADATPGSSIYYTLSGLKPAPGQSGTYLYTAPFTINASCAVKAEGIEISYTPSDILSETFTVQTATPRVTPNGGTHTAPVSTTLTDTTAGSTIYYTTDGSTPSPGIGTTHAYTAPLTISPGTTIQALATAPGQTASAIVTATFR